MAEPTPTERAARARTFLERLGIDTRRRRRPMVEIGPAQVERPGVFAPEDYAAADEELAASQPAARESSRRDAEIATLRDAAAEEARRTAEDVAAASPGSDRAYGNVRAGLPEWVSDDVARGVASVPGMGVVFDTDVDNAAINGSMEGLTFGHSAEAAGAVRGGLFAPSRSGRIADEDIGHGRYRRERDRVAAQQDASSARAPVTSALAEGFASLGPTLAIPAPGRTATLTERVLAAGGTGLGLGALYGSGHSRADVGSDQYLRDIGRNAVVGMGTGVGSELAMAGLGAGYRALRGRHPDAPAPGGDFTPEQRARIDADPELGDLDYQRELIEDQAAQRRVRSTADAAALADVRRAGDYAGPGGEGYRGLARDLDTTGIMPRRSMDSGMDAQLRADRIRREAGQALGDVRSQMRRFDAPESVDADILANTDEELAALNRRARELHAEERATARAVDADMPHNPLVSSETRDALDALDASTPEWRASQRDPQVEATIRALEGPQARDMTATAGSPRRSPRARQAPAPRQRVIDPGYEPIPPEEARAAALLRRDPMVRYDERAQALIEQARRESRAAVTPGQQGSAGSLETLGESLAGRQPETFDQSYDVLRGLDREAGYGRVYPNAPDAGPRVEQARAGRRVVRGAMDDAVERTLGPDALAEYQRQRGRYGAAAATQTLGQRGAAREAANLQAGLGDTIAIQQGINAQPTAGVPARLWNAIEGVVVNRYLRGRGHALAASLGEMRGDALADAITRRLAETPSGAAAARALVAAQSRGPRAFGIVMMRLAEQDPEVQQAVTDAIISEQTDWQDLGVQTADQYDTEGAQGPVDDTDWNALGVQTADQYTTEDDDATQRRR